MKEIVSTPIGLVIPFVRRSEEIGIISCVYNDGTGTATDQNIRVIDRIVAITA